MITIVFPTLEFIIDFQTFPILRMARVKRDEKLIYFEESQAFFVNHFL